MSDAIRVICRFRPKNKVEERMERGNSELFRFNGNTVIAGNSEAVSKGVGTFPEGAPFTFDELLSNVSQAQLYEAVNRSFISNLLEGYNCTLFAYGQTGTGKTYSLMGGTGESEGVLPRLIRDIFERPIDQSDLVEQTLKVSFCEIYLEKLRDLLSPDASQDLRIREGGKHEGVWIQGIIEQTVTSYQDVMSLISIGNENRTVGETKMNEKSSRSHSVFILHIEQTDLVKNISKKSKLIVIDLAGSEKVNKTGATGLTLLEAQHTNKSLTALGIVIKSLTEKSAHIPYRDSKLTRILTDSLGGNSKTCLLVTCSPAEYNYSETISTLRFGTRVKTVKNKPKVNVENTIEEYKKLILDYKAKLSSGASIGTGTDEASDKISQLQSELTIKTNQLEKLVDELRSKLAEREEELTKLTTELTTQKQETEKLYSIISMNSKAASSNIHKDQMIAMLESAIKKARSDLTQQREQYDVTIQHLQNRLDDAMFRANSHTSAALLRQRTKR